MFEDSTAKIIDDLVRMSAEYKPEFGEVRACNCIGPQHGEKLCPCMLSAQRNKEIAMLRDGIIINGKRYKLVPDASA